MFYSVGLGLRVYESTRLEGRVVLIVDIVFWYMLVLEQMMVSADLGLFIIMITKMIPKALGLLFILLVFLTAFGVTWQGIRFQVFHLYRIF